MGAVALIAAASSALTVGIITHNNSKEQSTTIVEQVAPTPNIFASTAQGNNYPDLTEAAERAVKAVVNIEVRKKLGAQRAIDPFYLFFGMPDTMPEREAQAGGSGVIISSDGYIVTNNHVIEGATTVRVKLADGRAYDAKIIGSDPATDVALLKIDAE